MKQMYHKSWTLSTGSEGSVWLSIEELSLLRMERSAAFVNVIIALLT